MFARADRLHPRSRVRSTIRNGRRVRSGTVVVHFVAGGHGPQAAVVAGKNVGGSVERHRRQRQLRHAMSAVWDELPAGGIVVRALPGEATYAQLESHVRAAVAKL